MSAACVLALAATTLAAFPASPAERVRLFADCAGRYSALEVHLWMSDGPSSESAARRRDDFADLVDAVLPDALSAGLPPSQPMAWRVAAKAAQIALFSRGYFGTDRAARAASLSLAQDYIAACDRLLPGA